MLVVMRKWLASLGRKWSCRASRSAPLLEVRGHREVRGHTEVRAPTRKNMKLTATLVSTLAADNSCEEAGAI